ncbi:MAG TPA: twin-arginine translocation signal domain-containing protein [Opitutaceae bacterium]|nr:twin-arginine translocation signal domain-containing protein [Opitutaceae bacterium]
MNSVPLSRRDFVKNAALATAALQIPSVLRAADAPAAGSGPAPAPDEGVELHWLEGAVPPVSNGVTWGVPWPRGRHARDTAFTLRTAGGEVVPVQSWPLAFWPDGSLKWTAHTVPALSVSNGPAEGGKAEKLLLAAGTPAVPAQPVQVTETPDAVEVDTGVIRCRMPRKGAVLIASITRGGREIARDGRLVALRSDGAAEGEGAVRTEAFQSEISAVAVEQRGPVRAVVKIDGQHRNANRAWLPFSVRLYFSAGGEAVRMMHSFVFDGDVSKDFLRGLGARFSVPLRDPLHDRHVRFVGEGKGLWAEAVRGLTGLRRDPGEAVKQAQLAGQSCPPVKEWKDRGAVSSRLQYIPAWGDCTLFQSAANAFEIRKRTQLGFGWVGVDQGARAAGVGYVGGATGGGVVFGLRDFWQRHPTQLDIRNAHTDAAEVTVWLWSPEASPMDLRFYHDVMGMETYEKQYDGGLEITYEDYEPGWGDPHGIARTSEIMLWALAATPSRDRILEFAGCVQTPPQLACAPAHLHATDVFGGLFSLPDRSTPARAAIEDRLDWQFDYYHRQVEQRHWYGFWNYGDVMHTYDRDRHVWRYDVGGFAWDNSELSPDLWLWYAYLRSGRADIFRLAEAMTRHTGEVDVYHLGRFAGLGSRHNVQHWGCSAKQVRISTAIYRRFYYYLTADERVGDLMRALVDCDYKLKEVNPGRKLAHPGSNPHPASVSLGTDWCSFCAAWFTEWERTGEAKYRDKMIAGLKSIAAAPHGWFTAGWGYDPDTGILYPLGDRIGVSHLNAVFGAVEINAEMLQSLDVPEYERAWLQYCELYNAGGDEQEKVLGVRLHDVGLPQAHSRLTAYAAWKKRDAALAARAWKEFAHDWMKPDLQLKHVEGPAVLNPVDEAAWVSTNDAAQWALAAMQNLALVPEALSVA